MGEEPYHTTARSPGPGPLQIIQYYLATTIVRQSNRETSDLNGSLGVLIGYVNVYRPAYIQPALAYLHLRTDRVPAVTKSATAIDLVRVGHDVGAVREFS